LENGTLFAPLPDQGGFMKILKGILAAGLAVAFLALFSGSAHAEWREAGNSITVRIATKNFLEGVEGEKEIIDTLSLKPTPTPLTSGASPAQGIFDPQGLAVDDADDPSDADTKDQRALVEP
jgi:hypothetical protein